VGEGWQEREKGGGGRGREGEGGGGSGWKYWLDRVSAQAVSGCLPHMKTWGKKIRAGSLFLRYADQ
jgi:hypothetical protein